MATKKTTRSRAARPTGKKGTATKAARRPLAKATPKRARKATAKPPARSGVLVVPPAEPLFRAAELDGIERKPTRKIEAAPRPARPPARLPIPQSTYFF